MPIVLNRNESQGKPLNNSKVKYAANLHNSEIILIRVIITIVTIIIIMTIDNL